jgi:hypothetical protein
MIDKGAWVAAAPSKTIQRLAELPSHSKVPYIPTIASGRVLSVQEVTLSYGSIIAARSDGSYMYVTDEHAWLACATLEATQSMFDLPTPVPHRR